jgi:hypothetical protein
MKIAWDLNVVVLQVMLTELAVIPYTYWDGVEGRVCFITWKSVTPLHQAARVSFSSEAAQVLSIIYFSMGTKVQCNTKP